MILKCFPFLYRFAFRLLFHLLRLILFNFCYFFAVGSLDDRPTTAAVVSFSLTLESDTVSCSVSYSRLAFSSNKVDVTRGRLNWEYNTQLNNLNASTSFITVFITVFFLISHGST